MSFLRLIFHLFFPAKCMVCGKIGEPLCQCCADEMINVERPSHCLVCGLPAPCKIHKNRYCATSVTLHKGQARNVVLALKYRNFACLGVIMGKAIGRHINKPEDDEWYIAYVPLHRSSNRKYNQARCIASGLAAQWHFPLIKRGLKWSVDRIPQSSSDSKTRRSLPVSAISWGGGEITGKNIILVDDVRTTGTTLLRSSRILYSAGAARVTCVTWSRTPYNTSA